MREAYMHSGGTRLGDADALMADAVKFRDLLLSSGRAAVNPAQVEVTAAVRS
jgi:hypothetical protein